jgi:hypothetical protein
MTTQNHERVEEFIEKLFNARLETIDRVLEEREKRLVESGKVLDARLAYLNELRGDVVTRGEFKAGHESLFRDVQEIKLWRAELAGKSSRANLYSLGAIGIAIISVIVHWLK